MAARHLIKTTTQRCVFGIRPQLTRLTTSHLSSLEHTSHQNNPVQFMRTTAFHTSVCRQNEHIFNIQDDDDFQMRVLKSETPVVVDFHAGWCGPCKLLGPRLEAAIADRQGKVLMAKVDIDDHSDLAIFHGVEAVPTVLGIKNGKTVEKFVGVRDEKQIESFIDKITGE